MRKPFVSLAVTGLVGLGALALSACTPTGPKLVDAYSGNDLFPFCVGAGQCGLITDAGGIALAPEYDAVVQTKFMGDPIAGRLLVQQNGKFGVTNAGGKYDIAPDWITLFYHPDGDVWIGHDGTGYHIINGSGQNRAALDSRIKGVLPVPGAAILAVPTTSDQSWMDVEGETFEAAPAFDLYHTTIPLTKVDLPEETFFGFFPTVFSDLIFKDGDEFGLVSVTGEEKLRIDIPADTGIEGAIEELIAAEAFEKIQHVIDNVRYRYRADPVAENLFQVVKEDGTLASRTSFSSISKFKEDRAVASTPDGTGVISKQFKFIVPPSYDMVELDADGRARFKSGTQVGVIDRSGKEIFSTSECDKITYQNNLMVICQNFRKTEKYGLLDYDGESLLKFVYPGLEMFETKSGQVTILKTQANGKYGLLSTLGQTVLEQKYDFIKTVELDDGLIFEARQGEAKFLFDSDGKAIPINLTDVSTVDVVANYIVTKREGKFQFNRTDGTKLQVPEMDSYDVIIREGEPYILLSFKGQEYVMTPEGDMLGYSSPDQ